jgi:MraZ protein
MFRGSSFHTLDNKNRVKIPSRYCEILRGNNDLDLVLTAWEGYILAYPLSAWLKMEQKYAQADEHDMEERMRIRDVMSDAQDCTLDRQGRILIPQFLKDYARIDKEVAVVGMINNFEIWNRELFDAYRNQRKESGSKRVLPGLSIQ